MSSSAEKRNTEAPQTATEGDALDGLTRRGLEILREDDPTLHRLLHQDYHRQRNVLAMVAASSIADPSVLVCEGLATANVTTEGYPGARFHAGCEFVDGIERLAIERAKAAFGAKYANVQPHSGSSANAIVMFRLLKPGDTILGLDLNSGGHLTHGAKASFSGQYFNAAAYGLNEKKRIDYEALSRLAHEHRPRLIICGASAYPRTIDFALFRQIADEVDAFLLADISHIAGLVVSGLHPSPIDHAHFTTTSTYKQLFGPRGGLILIGKDHDSPGPNGRTLAEMTQRAVFPFLQGTPNLSAIAAKARALELVVRPEFGRLARRIVDNARALAEAFAGLGYNVLTGGTDNHMVLMEILSRGMTGVVAEQALEQCNIIINKNRIHGDQKSALITSGIRLGTNSLSLRGMGADEMALCAALVDDVLSSLRVTGDRSFEIDEIKLGSVRDRVRRLCDEFPIPDYPAVVPAR